MASKRVHHDSESHFRQFAQYKVVTANSYLDHQSKLTITDRPGNVRNTSVICTIGELELIWGGLGLGVGGGCIHLSFCVVQSGNG